MTPRPSTSRARSVKVRRARSASVPRRTRSASVGRPRSAPAALGHGPSNAQLIALARGLNQAFNNFDKKHKLRWLGCTPVRWLWEPFTIRITEKLGRRPCLFINGICAVCTARETSWFPSCSAILAARPPGAISTPRVCGVEMVALPRTIGRIGRTNYGTLKSSPGKIKHPG